MIMKKIFKMIKKIILIIILIYVFLSLFFWAFDLTSRIGSTTFTGSTSSYSGEDAIKPTEWKNSTEGWKNPTEGWQLPPEWLAELQKNN